MWIQIRLSERYSILYLSELLDFQHFFLSLSLCKEMWNRLPKGQSDRAPVCKGKIRTKLGPFCCEAGNIPQNGEDTVRGRQMEIVIYEMCFIFVDFVDV